MDTLPKFLTKDNDGTTKNANGDYSATPARFIVKASDTGLDVDHLIIEIDDSDANLSTYGNMSALTNGIEFRIEHETSPGFFELVRTLFAGAVIKKTIDWSPIGGIITPLQQGSATKGVQVRLDLSDQRVELKQNTGMCLVMYCADDLSGLDLHTALAVGT